MGKLIIVSNRLPVSVERKGGRLNLTASVGGLATGLGSIYRRLKSLWIGWPGIIPKTSEEKYFLEEKFREFGCKPVFLSRYSLENYYYGFSNRTIWPLFHYFPQHTVYSQTYWRTYRHVNNVFCRRVLEEAEPEDVIWVHDYHLMLLPKMLRERLPEATIGFFLHIPFPSTEIFRLLPWRREILEGMLGADLVGFHTYDYVRHFLDSVLYLLEYEHEMGWISLEDRKVRVDAFPMGIDVEKFEKALGSPEVERELQKLKRRVGGKKSYFLHIKA